MSRTRRTKRSPFKKSDVAKFQRRVKKTRGCWIWCGKLTDTGYGLFYAGGKTILAHRYAWRLANDRRRLSVKQLVIHACDNRRCVNPRHLSVGSHRQNIREAFERQRHPRCARVFTTADVRRIRTCLKKSERYTELAWANSAVTLAKKYGVGRSTINRIKDGTYTPYGT